MKAVIVKANNLLSDPNTSAQDLKALVKELKAAHEFGLACRVLQRMEEKHFPSQALQEPPSEWDEARRAHWRQIRPEALWVQQQSALCTYKDEDVHASIRLPRALEILRALGLEKQDRQATETLALAGAIYKRLWEFGHRSEDLYRSLAYYERAWRTNPAKDLGYGGVNAVFILELLACDARRSARVSAPPMPEARMFAARAERLRKAILRVLLFQSKRQPSLKGTYWFLTTLAEVKLGQALQIGARSRTLPSWRPAGKVDPRLADRNEVTARGLFRQAAAICACAAGLKPKPSPWELQTTATQLIKLILLYSVPPPSHALRKQPDQWHPAWRALEKLLGPHAFGFIAARGGKVGLALSGGGFRASLFHLGVLARLAEMDVLRRVEVLSTVSGGSILGAHYYLEVKRLLETTPDTELTREHYIELVRRVQHNFLTAIQENLRVRALGGWWSNLKVVCSGLGLPCFKRHTRSIRLAELYQERIYDQVPHAARESGEQAMADLRIAPMGEGPVEEFRPAQANWRRQAKVPVLLLNSTSLNSGHNFQFTANSMGEPPGLTGAEVDMNARYRRVYYEELRDPALNRFPLGQAVAASAGVPGLFEPIELPGLYPGEHVRLVDGGVHDNQGVAGLLDEDCGLILCSDASGQMDDQIDPKASRMGALLRMNSILQDRVREAQYQELDARANAGTLDGVFFIHMKQDLVPDAKDWIDCSNPTPPQPLCNLTPYGIDRDLQLSLSALRTDLDSFTEVEAYALMLSGYEMTRHEFAELARKEARKFGRPDSDPLEWRGFDAGAPVGQWPFQELSDLMRKPRQSSDQRRKDLGFQLDVGAEAAFKIWRLDPRLRGVALLLGLALVVGAIGWVFTHWDAEIDLGLVRVKTLGVTIGFAVAVGLVPLLAWAKPLQRLRSFILSLGLVTVGWVVAWIHLLVFDRLFLKRGLVKRLLRLRAD